MLTLTRAEPPPGASKSDLDRFIIICNSSRLARLFRNDMILGVNKLTILFIEKRKSLTYCNESNPKQAIEGEFMKKEIKNLHQVDIIPVI